MSVREISQISKTVQTSPNFSCMLPYPWLGTSLATLRYVMYAYFRFCGSCLQIMTGYSKMVHASRDSPEGSTGAKSDVYVIISSLCLPVGFHFSRKRRDFPHERNFYRVGTPALARLNFAWWKLSEALSQCRMWVTGINWARASWGREVSRSGYDVSRWVTDATGRWWCESYCPVAAIAVSIIRT